MAEESTPPIAPATDSSPSARTVDEAAGKASATEPYYAPKGRHLRFSARIPIEGPVGDEYYERDLPTTKDLLKAVKGLPDEADLSHDILQRHTGHEYLIPPEQFEEESKPLITQSIYGLMEAFQVPGSFGRGISSAAASFLPDPTEGGEAPTLVSSVGDAFEWTTGKIARQWITSESQWASQDLPPEELSNLAEELGGSIYRGFATGLAHELGSIKEWEHLPGGIEQHSGESWIDATVPKELAERIADNAVDPVTEQFFRNLSTDTGRMMYGLAIDIVADPLWLAGPAGGSVAAMAKTGTLAGKAFVISGPLAKAARAAGEASGASPRKFANAVVDLFEGAKAEKAAARRLFDDTKATLTGQSNRAKYESESLQKVLLSGNAESLIPKALSSIDKQKRLIDDSIEAYLVTGEKTVDIEKQRKVLASFERERALIGDSAQQAEKYIKSKIKILNKQANKSRAGVDSINKTLRFTGDDAVKAGVLAEKGSIAWHIPFSDKTNYLFSANNLEKIGGALSKAPLIRTVDKFFDKNALTPKRLENKIAEERLRTGNPSLPIKDALNSMEQTAWAMGRLGWSVAEMPMVYFDKFTQVVGTRMWQPMFASLSDKASETVFAVEGFLGSGNYLRLQKIDPDLWETYQDALTKYTRTLGANNDKLLSYMSIITKQAESAFLYRKKKIDEGIIDSIDDDINKIKKALQREKKPGAIFTLKKNLSELINKKEEALLWKSDDYSVSDVMLEIGTLTESGADRLKVRPEFTHVNPLTGMSMVDSIEEIVKDFTIRFGKEREEVVQALVHMSRRLRGDAANEAQFIETLKLINETLSKVDTNKERALAAIQNMFDARKDKYKSFLSIVDLINPDDLATALERVLLVGDTPWNEMVQADYIRRVIMDIVGEKHVDEVLYNAANYMGFRGGDGERAMLALSKMVAGEKVKGGKKLTQAVRAGPGRAIKTSIDNLQSRIDKDANLLRAALSGDLKDKDVKRIVSDVLDEETEKDLAKARTILGDKLFMELANPDKKRWQSLRSLGFKNTEELMRSMGINPTKMKVDDFKEARKLYSDARTKLHASMSARSSDAENIKGNLYNIGVHGRKHGVLTKDGLLSKRFEYVMETAKTREEAEQLVFNALEDLLPIDSSEEYANLARTYAQRFVREYKPTVEELLKAKPAAAPKAGKEPPEYMLSEGPSDAVSDLAREADTSTVAAFADLLRGLPEDSAKALDILKDWNMPHRFGPISPPRLYIKYEHTIKDAKQNAHDAIINGVISADFHRLITFLADNLDELKKLPGQESHHPFWHLDQAHYHSASLFTEARKLAIKHSIPGVTAEDILTGRFADAVAAVAPNRLTARWASRKLDYHLAGMKKDLKTAQKYLDDAGIDYKLSTPLPSRVMLARRAVKNYYWELGRAAEEGLPTPETPTLDIVRQPPGLPKKGAGYETFGAGEGADFSRATMDIDPNTTLDDLFAGVDTSAPDLPASGLTTPEDFSAFIKTPEGATWYERAAARKRGRGQILRRTLRTRDILGKAWKTDSGVATIPDYEYDMLKQFVAMVGTSRLQNIALSIEPKIATRFMLNEPLGLYMFGEDVVGISYSAIAQGRFVDTTIHELWHSLSRYLPDDTVKSLYKQFTREREAFMRANPEAFDRSGALSSIDFAKDQSTYRFSSFDEWVVEKMKDLSIEGAASRLRVKGTAGTEVPYSKPWQRALGALSDLVVGHYNQMKAVLGQDVARKTYMDFMKGKYLDQVRDSPLRDVIKITPEDEARAAARWAEYLDALDLHLKFPLAEKGLAAAEAKMARESEKFLESMITGPAESLPAGEFRALAARAPGDSPTKPIKGTIKTEFPWTMRNTKGQLTDAAEAAGIVVSPKATKSQILDAMKAAGPRMEMSEGARAVEAVKVAKKQLESSIKERIKTLESFTKAKKKFHKAEAKNHKDALRAEAKAIEAAAKEVAAGTYFPSHPEGLTAKTAAGGTKQLPYRAMEEWERELMEKFDDVTKNLSEDDRLFAAFTALRSSPTAPSELQKWQIKLAEQYPGFLGRRLGEVPDELQDAVIKMRALVKRYEDAFTDRGAAWLKDPLQMMREWGVIEFVPHITDSKKAIANGTLSSSLLSGTVHSDEISPINSLDQRLSGKFDGEKRRSIEGTIREINAVANASNNTELVASLDPPGIIARYMQANRKLAAQDFVLALLRGGVIQRFDLPEAASRKQMVPLFSRRQMKMTQDVLFSGTKDDWAGAGVSSFELEQIRSAFSYDSKESDVFAAWMQESSVLNSVNKVERAVALIREKQWSTHLNKPITDELFDPQKIFDEKIGKISFADMPEGKEAGVIDKVWQEVADELNRVSASNGLRATSSYRVSGEDLSLVYGQGSEAWKLYIPATVKVSMSRVLGIGETMTKNTLGKTADAANNFFKTRVTILAIAFSSRNALSNTFSNILDLGVGGALDPSTNITALRLSDAASYVTEYGSLSRAAAELSDVFTDVSKSEERLKKLIYGVPQHEISKDPRAGAEIRRIIRGLRWNATGMDDLLKKGVDLGDGVTRSADEAIALMEDHGVVTAAYRQFVDVGNFETSFAEIMSRGFMHGEWDAAALAAKKTMSTFEDVSLVGLGMLMSGGIPIAVPKKAGEYIARFVENQARVTNFIGNLKRGRTTTEAADSVAKHLFDYNDLTFFQKKWMRTAFTFFTWNQKNVHLQLEMMQKAPAFYSKFGNMFLYQFPEAMASTWDKGESHYRSPQYIKENLMLRDSYAMHKIRLPFPHLEVGGKTILPGKPGMYFDGLGLPLEGFAEMTSMLVDIPMVAYWGATNHSSQYSDDTKLRIIGQAHWAFKFAGEVYFKKHAHYGRPIKELTNGKIIGEMIGAIRPVSPDIAEMIKDATGFFPQRMVNRDGRIVTDMVVTPTANHMFSNLPYSRVIRDASAVSDLFRLSTISTPEELLEGSYQEIPYALRLMDALSGIKIIQQQPAVRRAIHDRRMRDMYEDMLEAQNVTETMDIQYVPKN